MIFGILIIFSGLGPLFRAQHIIKAVDQRIEQGDDRYFEEQRSYRAYPPIRNPNLIRLGGAALVAMGLTICALDYPPVLDLLFHWTVEAPMGLK